MTATIIQFADYHRPRAVAPSRSCADETAGVLLVALAAEDRAVARLRAAEVRGALPPEVAFLRGLWRKARIRAAVAQSCHTIAVLRAA